MFGLHVHIYNFSKLFFGTQESNCESNTCQADIYASEVFIIFLNTYLEFSFLEYRNFNRSTIEIKKLVETIHLFYIVSLLEKCEYIKYYI